MIPNSTQTIKNMQNTPEVFKKTEPETSRGHNKGQKIFIIAGMVVAVGTVIAFLAYLYIAGTKSQSQAERALNEYNQSLQQINESAAKGVLPDIRINAMEEKPNVNPAQAGNPMENIKTNPFE